MKALWRQAAGLAAQTPQARNRYVDFLRALSIFAVVFGHWLMAAPYVGDDGIVITSMLEHQPWTRWMTWAFQVMPVFFLVGGYSNGISWQSAQRRGQGYAEWLQLRLGRLAGPVLPLLVMWMVLAAGAQAFGVHPQMVKVASQMALIPIWFLAVYLFVVVLVPVTAKAWARWGFWSFWMLVAAAVANDVLFFAADLRALGWLNYAFVWLAVHQLGYAWRDGHMAGMRQGLTWVAGGLVVMIGLITLGPYPVSMVSVPGEAVSNTLPPKIAMLVLGIVQCGLLLSMEAPMRRWLSRPRPWTAVVLVNSMIMTIFLWHSTVMMLLVGLAFWQLPGVLAQQPNSTGWWVTRPVWLLVYTLVTLPFLLVFARFERPSADHGRRPAAAWLQLVGCVIACFGLAMLALDGVGGDGWLGLRWMPLLTPLVGAGLAGFGPLGTIGRGLSGGSG
jgi:hypothetical protein